MTTLFRIFAFALIPMAFGQGPANVLIVVNGASAVSRNIGEYYARRRGVSQKNICTLQAPVKEEVTRAEYDRFVRSPVANCLRQKQLTEQIRYIATTLGVPLKVAGTDGQGGDAAAVDSELALLYTELSTGRTHLIAGRQRNPLYRQRDAQFDHKSFPIYLVTRLAAYDFAGVREMIDRSIASSSSARNRGNFVIDKRGDGAGDEWLENAAIFLPKERVVLEETSKVLYGQQDVIGYAGWGSNDSARKQRFVGFQWLPGAIATEFVSTNGRTFDRPPTDWKLSDWNSPQLWWRGAPQTLTADYIEDGASAATGHVYEPYLDSTPRPEILFPAYYSGRNLAESFYLSIPYLSWQNIVVGDPLMTIGN